MLHVIGVAGAEGSSIAVDDYVALSWRCKDVPAPLYWRTGDLDTSLLEIGLLPESGRLCKITIVAAHGCLRQDVNTTLHYLNTAQQREGLPCCDTHRWLERQEWPDMGTWENRERTWMFDTLHWQERIVDDAGPFTISIVSEGISVWLGDPKPLTTCYVTPTLRCGVDANAALCLLHFEGLSDHERRHMVATIAAVVECSG